MARIPEQTTCYVTVVPRDKTGTAGAPSSGNYRVHDVKSGDEIVAETALSASASMEIVLLGTTVNAFVDRSNKTEKRRVTVDLLFGAGDPLNDEYVYTIERLTDLP